MIFSYRDRLYVASDSFFKLLCFLAVNFELKSSLEVLQIECHIARRLLKIFQG
jgi:hypothetical protein